MVDPHTHFVWVAEINTGILILFDLRIEKIGTERIANEHRRARSLFLSMRAMGFGLGWVFGLLSS